ncbi:MAG: hypothetical protein AB1942_09670 [Pseudomonadota bacterium]
MALVMAAALPAAAAPPITKTEARQSSLAKTKRRVLDQLGDILVEDERPRSRKPMRPLDDLGFTTLARSTSTHGLCAYDVVTILFRPTNDQDLGADLPVRANGITAVTRYALLGDPGPAGEAGSIEPTPADDRACRGLPQQRYFSAPSETVAVEGAAWLKTAVATARDPVVRVSCSAARELAEPACRSLIATMKLEHVWAMDTDGDRGGKCWSYELEIGGEWYAVRACEAPERPGGLKTVEVREQIVSIHQRID